MVVDVKRSKHLIGLMTECSERGVVLCNLCTTESSSRTRGARIRIVSRYSEPWRSITEDKERKIDNGQKYSGHPYRVIVRYPATWA